MFSLNLLSLFVLTAWAEDGGKILPFPHERVATTEVDHTQTPLCDKLLVPDLLKEKVADQLAKRLKDLHAAENHRAYNREVRKLIAQVKAVGIYHSASFHIWMPAMNNEIAEGRLVVGHGLTPEDILQAEILLLNTIDHFPMENTQNHFPYETQVDFFSIRLKSHRADPRWRRAWLDANTSLIQTLAEKGSHIELIRHFSDLIEDADLHQLPQKARAVGTAEAIRWADEVEEFLQLIATFGTKRQ